MKKMILVAVILSIAFAACKKDNDTPKGVTMTTWKASVLFYITGTGDVIVDWCDGSPKETETFDDYGFLNFRHSYENNKTRHTITITGDNITRLDFGYNQLRTLSVCDFTNLKTLNCGGNELLSLNINGLTNLEKLDCSGNYLKSLDVSEITKLKTLRCSINLLKSLDVSRLSNLEELSCCRNQLTSLNVSGLVMLHYLPCEENYMSAVALNDLFTSLPKVPSESPGHINISSNGPDYDGTGTDGCDKSIAEKKGWIFL
jgi:hypothetical protein